MTTSTHRLSDFVTAYLECALWSSTDDNDQPLDEHYGIEDFSDDSIMHAIEDCGAFQAQTELHCDYAAHDFWLTRNHHGAGFWDGRWSNGEQLTEIAHLFGMTDVIVSDSGELDLL